MQQCPRCNRIYDESESCRCPFCYHDDDREIVHIVYDHEQEKVLNLSDAEYEEFKKTHPDYH